MKEDLFVLLFKKMYQYHLSLSLHFLNTPFQLSQMKYFYSLFEQYLPNKPVFFTFGNHDTVPVNNFPQPFISGNQSKDWITEPTLSSWSKWLSAYPDWNTTQATIKK